MQPMIRRATVLACAAVFTASCTSAFARPSHHHHRHHHRSIGSSAQAEAHRHHRHRRFVQRISGGQGVNPYYGGPGAPKSYAFEAGDSFAYAPATTPRRHARMRPRRATAAPVASFGGGGGLVADARRYIGTNPTGRRSLWCGAFMDKVLRDTGHRGGGNLAKGYLHYGRRVSGPQVGAIAVMGRRGGGHVGVVSGVDASGNPIIISGNHNHTVAEATYPRSRIIAYVMPGG
jgi:uncharacterized protein (TIGR02594 family)